jgi:hypothetical protein
LPSQAVIELAKAFPRVAYASRDISCDDVKELLQVIATELNCELPPIPEAFADKIARNLYSALAEANRQKGVDSRKLIRAYERIGKAVRELSASLNFQKMDDPEARAIAHDVRIAIGEFAEWANPSRQSTKTDGFEQLLSFGLTRESVCSAPESGHLQKQTGESVMCQLQTVRLSHASKVG